MNNLSELNSFPVYDITGEQYRTYGRVYPSLRFPELIQLAENFTEIPENGNVYVPSFEKFEQCSEAHLIRHVCFGGMPVQFGYCNGKNKTFNGFEYHKASEINVAVTDLCISVGHCWDITQDLTYDVDKAEVFFVPKGTVFEMYGTTLHLSPLTVSDEGFKNIVVLPLYTNTPLPDDAKVAAAECHSAGDGEARLLLQKSKWVISHPDREPLIRQGAWPGVIGENKELKYK